jgi:hypothetical protein
MHGEYKKIHYKLQLNQAYQHVLRSRSEAHKDLTGEVHMPSLAICSSDRATTIVALVALTHFKRLAQIKKT